MLKFSSFVLIYSSKEFILLNNLRHLKNNLKPLKTSKIFLFFKFNYSILKYNSLRFDQKLQNLNYIFIYIYKESNNNTFPFFEVITVSNVACSNKFKK